MGETTPKVLVLEPLDIKCTSTNCENGLHCFKQKKERRRKAIGEDGAVKTEAKEQGGGNIIRPCRECGVDLIDWGRVYQHDLNDVNHTFDALKKELVRHYYWHLAVDQRARNHALRKGSIQMDAFVEKRIRSSVGSENNFREGMQTPDHQSGNIVHYAQHATASCCRACIEGWHGIPKDRALTDPEVRYLTDLAMLYINERLPELTPEAQKIPFIRQNSKNL